MNRNYNKILFYLYLTIWSLLAISPKYREDWFLENILIFISIPTLLYLNNKFSFSKIGATSLFIFLTIHSIGSHYTYSETPLFLSISEYFQLDRNHFDRVAHFLFGFLLAIPLSDLVRRVNSENWIKAILVISTIYSSTAVYEVLEWLVTEITHPQLGTAFLGVQGDEWDAQKDMALAQIGVLLSSPIWLKILKSEFR